MTNERIIQGIIKKDRTFNYLYQHFGPKVLGYVIKNSGNVEDGEHILTDTIVKVWENVRDGKYKPKGKFQAYFMRIAILTWHESLRVRKKRHIFHFLKEGHQEIKDKGGEELEEKKYKEELLNQLQKIIKTLDAQSRELLQLYYTEKIPVKEIARRKNVDPKTMAKRLYDCRKKIQNSFYKIRIIVTF